MRSVSVAELKNDVGRYLDEVLAGAEVVIEDQDQPVAKIIPFSRDDDEDDEFDDEFEEHLAKLAAEGKARLPIEEGPLPPEFWTEPPFNVSAEDLVALVSEDRDED
ncbi:MAG: type II toxin-antitoxin system Phd/YefM family antitoxin [Blastocatellia bacterium]